MKKPNFSWKRVADSFSTRSFRAGGYSVAAAAIVLAIAVMVNVFAAALPASVTKFDTTANQLFTLSEQTEKLVGSLTDEVTVYWIVRSGREESYLESLLSRYQAEGEKMLEHTGVYVCSVCGFVYVGDAPPEICPVCKVPSWKFERVERGA